MKRISGEALTISALLNSHDVESARSFGIAPGHFRSYGNQYQWCLNYLKNYGEQPSWEIFLAEFPTFPRSTHEDVRSAVDVMLRGYYSKQLAEALDSAATALGAGDTNLAIETVQAIKPVYTSAKPRNLVTDQTFFDTFSDIQYGIELPQRSLQRWTGGIGKGQLWYVGARLGNGKSAHMLNWSALAAAEGYRVKFYSLEMTEMEVRGRVHAILANRYGYPFISSLGIHGRTVDPHRYKTFVSELADKIDGTLDIHTPAEGMVSPSVIASSMENYDLIVVDHVGLLRPDAGGYSTDDWRVAARNSNALRELTLASGTPLMAAAQINREGEHGRNPPDVKNLAGTDALGQDADVVITMRAMSRDVASMFYLPKNRHGYGKKKWWTKFDPNWGCFDEITEDQAEELVMKAEDDE